MNAGKVVPSGVMMFLQDSNSKKDHPELFLGRLSDNKVNDRKKIKNRAREGYLALVLRERRSRERV